MEAREAQQGVALARECRPRVIVLDSECEEADEERVCGQYTVESRDSNALLLILGKSILYEQAVPQDRIVPKPYHYAHVIRTIERLLGTSEDP